MHPGSKILPGDIAPVRDTFEYDRQPVFSGFNGHAGIALEVVTTGSDGIKDPGQRANGSGENIRHFL
ncbi:MAG: hypothetical protein ACLFQ9_10810 [Desulfobacterales bacterium]